MIICRGAPALFLPNCRLIATAFGTLKYDDARDGDPSPQSYPPYDILAQGWIFPRRTELVWPVIHLQREWRRGIRLFPRGAGLLGQKVCFERIKLCHASYKLEENLQSKLDFSRWSGGENFHEIRGPNGSSGGPSKVSEAPMCPCTRRCKVHPVEEIEGLHP